MPAARPGTPAISVSWWYSAGKWLLRYPPKLETESQALYRSLAGHSPDEQGFRAFWRALEDAYRAKGVSIALRED